MAVPEKLIIECQLSKRPEGVICRETQNVRRIKYDQAGVTLEAYACQACQNKMLRGNIPAWSET